MVSIADGNINTPPRYRIVIPDLALKTLLHFDCQTTDKA